MESIIEIGRELKNNPYILYSLYAFYNNSCNIGLPKIVEREEVINYLIKKYLMKFISMENSDLKFTKRGITLYKKLERRGIFTLFREIDLSSRKSFERYYFKNLKKIENEFKYPESEIYQTLFLKMGKWIKPNGVPFKIYKITPILVNENRETIKFKYEIRCVNCNEVSSQEVEIIYNLNKIKCPPITVKCQLCGVYYKLCSNFKCLYSISKV